MKPGDAVHVALRTEHEVVLIKPSGMSCELPNDVRGVSLIERVRAGAIEGLQPCSDAKLPHRIDRAACGYVVVALTAEAIAHHNEQIKANARGKWYLARVGGEARGLIGEHKAYIKRKGRRAELVRAGGQPARLDVIDAQPAPQHDEQAHVLIRLHTGRYHQIRVMLAGLGAPLVGDGLYGGAPGEMYLEHAALRFVPLGEIRTPPPGPLPEGGGVRMHDGAIALFDECSPVRERVAPALIDALRRAISEVE